MECFDFCWCCHKIMLFQLFFTFHLDANKKLENIKIFDRATQQQKKKVEISQEKGICFLIKFFFMLLFVRIHSIDLLFLCQVGSVALHIKLLICSVKRTRDLSNYLLVEFALCRIVEFNYLKARLNKAVVLFLDLH